jgi:hypothetical protein
LTPSCSGDVGEFCCTNESICSCTTFECSASQRSVTDCSLEVAANCPFVGQTQVESCD